MIVLNENKNVLMDAKSIFISEIRDKEDKNLVIGHRIMAACETSPRPTTIRTFTGNNSYNQASQELVSMYARLTDAQ